MIKLSFPFTAEKIRALKVGDEVLISGVMHTGRDAVHKYLHEGGALPPGVSLRDGILYHCGPVMMKQEDGSAGNAPPPARRRPSARSRINGRSSATTACAASSARAAWARRRMAACKEHGCVYLHAIGGAAQVLAERIKKVRNVYFLEQFGSPEAVWELEVADFPAVVTIDAHGHSLHEEIFAKSQAALAERL